MFEGLYKATHKMGMDCDVWAAISVLVIPAIALAFIVFFTWKMYSRHKANCDAAVEGEQPKSFKCLVISAAVVFLVLIAAELVAYGGWKYEVNHFSESTSVRWDKPVVYLYPEERTEVTVTYDNVDALGMTYPEYANGWHVLAQPDGTLTDKHTGRLYNYLFWEGDLSVEVPFDTGYCVASDDVVSFLEQKLFEMGFTDVEAEDFITYWAPQMKGSPYVVMHFLQTEEVDMIMPMNVTPKPDATLRVWMYWAPSAVPVDISEQTLDTVNRDGFAVVEWGGAKVEM